MTNTKIKAVICEDLKRISYALPKNTSVFLKFIYALVWNKPYRAVFLL